MVLGVELGVGLQLNGALLPLRSGHGSAALAQQSSLEERCPDRACTPEAHGAADAYDATRAATTVGFIVGGVGLAAGVTLLVLDPSGEPADDAPDDTSARLVIRPGGLAVQGVFP